MHMFINRFEAALPPPPVWRLWSEVLRVCVLVWWSSFWIAIRRKISLCRNSLFLHNCCLLTWLTHLVVNLIKPFPRVGKDGEEAGSHRYTPTSAGSDKGLGMEVGIVCLQHEIAMVTVSQLP